MIPVLTTTFSRSLLRTHYRPLQATNAPGGYYEGGHCSYLWKEVPHKNGNTVPLTDTDREQTLAAPLLWEHPPLGVSINHRQGDGCD